MSTAATQVEVSMTAASGVVCANDNMRMSSLVGKCQRSISTCTSSEAAQIITSCTRGSLQATPGHGQAPELGRNAASMTGTDW